MKRILKSRLAIAALLSILATTVATECNGHWGGGSYGSSGGSSGISYGSSGGSSGYFRTPIRSYLRHVANRIHTTPYYGSHGSSGYTRLSHGSSGGSSGYSRMYYRSASSGGSSGNAIRYYGCSPAGGTSKPDPVKPKAETPKPQNKVEPPTPEKSGDKTTSLLRSGYLTVRVPANTTVYINDKLTKTTGNVRRYKTPAIQPGVTLSFKVKAVFEKEGKKSIQTKLVDLASGNAKQLDFVFATVPPPVTVLSLNVPENAKVTLAGKQTHTSGPLRMFTTTSLKRGDSWEDYKIMVETRINGKQVIKSKTINLKAGQSVDLDFDFETEYSQVASR